MEYHKIQSVYLRDPDTNYNTFLTGQYPRPEFQMLKDIEWWWTEKVDGTNIRVTYFTNNELDPFSLGFQGRTDKAVIPTPLSNKLHEMFKVETMARVFHHSDIKTKKIVLYGEGYGAGIQSGGDYVTDKNEVSFILFDVNIDGVWLDREHVMDIADNLYINVVPFIGSGSLAQAIALTKNGFYSQIFGARKKAEGLVCRPRFELQDRFGQRIITKIKTKDFER